MTPTQCVDLVEFLANRCPAMRMQDGTPDAWYVDLVEYDLADAMEAVLACTRRQTFVGLNDLLDECRSIVRARAGRVRRAELDAQIAAENDGDTDPKPIEAGDPAPSVAVAMRQAVASRPRKPPAETPRPDPDRLAAARAEVDRARMGTADV